MTYFERSEQAHGDKTVGCGGEVKHSHPGPVSNLQHPRRSTNNSPLISQQETTDKKINLTNTRGPEGNPTASQSVFKHAQHHMFLV